MKNISLVLGVMLFVNGFVSGQDVPTPSSAVVPKASHPAANNTLFLGEVSIPLNSDWKPDGAEPDTVGAVSTAQNVVTVNFGKTDLTGPTPELVASVVKNTEQDPNRSDVKAEISTFHSYPCVAMTCMLDKTTHCQAYVFIVNGNIYVVTVGTQDKNPLDVNEIKTVLNGVTFPGSK